VTSELQALRDQLPRIYQAARARDPRVAAFINSGCDIIEADDQMIKLGFMHTALLEKVENPQNLEVLTAVIREVLGRAVEVRCVHAPQVEAWTRRVPSSPLVRAAQEMGARVVAREPSAPKSVEE
jgi:hypothetical protein